MILKNKIIQKLMISLAVIPWERIFCSCNIDECLGNLYNVANNTIDIFVPIKCFKALHFSIWCTGDQENLVIYKKNSSHIFVFEFIFNIFY